jgi:hypothetical protein
MATQERQHAEPSTDFPAFDDTSPCPELRMSRMLLGLVAASALVGAGVDLIGRPLDNSLT